jgi:hypothetical protein
VAKLIISKPTPKKADTVVQKPVTAKDIELAQQEAIVFLFICTRLDTRGLNNDSAQYIATAVMGGRGQNKDRVSVQRTLDRLVAKGCLRIVEKGGRDSKGRILQTVHGPQSPKPIWGNKGSLHKSAILCMGGNSHFVQGHNDGQVPEDPTTSPSADKAICARAETLHAVHKSSQCNSTGCVSVDVGCKTADVSSVDACARRTPKKIAVDLQELRDELAHHEKVKNTKRIKACKRRIAELEAELTLARIDGGNQ